MSEQEYSLKPSIGLCGIEMGEAGPVMICGCCPSIGLCGIEMAEELRLIAERLGLQSDCVELKFALAKLQKERPQPFNRTVWN